MNKGIEKGKNISFLHKIIMKDREQSIKVYFVFLQAAIQTFNIFLSFDFQNMAQNIGRL